MNASPNNNICITGGLDGSIYIRDMKNLSNYIEIKGHNYKYAGVSSVAFSSNSNLIYSGGNDGALFIWELVPSEFIVRI